MSKFILSAFGDEIDGSLDTQMAVLAANGIRHIELRGVNGKNVSDLTLQEAEALQSQLVEKGFAISALGSPIGKIGIGDDFAPHMALFGHLLDIAGIFKTKYIRVFSFYIPEGAEPEQFRGEVLRRMRSLTQKAVQAGVTLLHENEKGIYGNTPGRCLEILQAIDSPCLKATFDPANFVQCGVTPYPGAFELLKDRIAYMHIKDARLSDGNVVPSGYGDGGVESILLALHRADFHGFLSIEPHLGYFPGLEKLEKTLDVSKIASGGADSFGVAADALKAILVKIGYRE